jgi:hypothetical protein
MRTHVERYEDTYIKRYEDTYIERYEDTYIERYEDTYTGRYDDTYVEALTRNEATSYSSKPSGGCGSRGEGVCVRSLA